MQPGKFQTDQEFINQQCSFDVFTLYDLLTYKPLLNKPITGIYNSTPRTTERISL